MIGSSAKGRVLAQGLDEGGAVHLRHVVVGDDEIPGRPVLCSLERASTGLAKAWTCNPSSTERASRVRILRLVTRSSMTTTLAISNFSSPPLSSFSRALSRRVGGATITG